MTGVLRGPSILTLLWEPSLAMCYSTTQFWSYVQNVSTLEKERSHPDSAEAVPVERSWCLSAPFSGSLLSLTHQFLGGHEEDAEGSLGEICLT